MVADENRLDLVFRALGDRTRRSLLARLQAAPSRITDLAEPFEMTLPAVSKHIRVLERAGLVRRNVDGRVHVCALQANAMQGASEWLDRYRVFWDANLESLAGFVERSDG